MSALPRAVAVSLSPLPVTVHTIVAPAGTSPRSAAWRSPATLAADVAGLICAADIARRNDDATRAARYERVADARQRRQLEPDGKDLGFLELVRLGVRTADDPAIVKALRTADRCGAGRDVTDLLAPDLTEQLR